ncbi:hypothetical protein BHYA_0004g01720 [Botrytis hyacinthi]|uniref:Protein kinase domain-containing protein n=1 Tax=Botrytis hyacinthi TaxID=278943 RepID=A0A4Z1H2S9_9HELO|nr:hypothetical protein BHYA_0004g01720 [Botrytis hyacinthi]
MTIDEDRAQWEKNLSFSTQRTDGDYGHNHEFTIIYNGKRFIVTVYLTSLPDDPITSLLSQFNKTILEDNDKHVEEIENGIQDIIYEAGWRKFAALVPGAERGPSDPPISLHYAFNPETFYFRLVIDGSNADIIQQYPSRSNFTPCLAINAISNLPTYSVQEILFIKKLMGTGAPMLKGFVVSDDDDGVIGILEEYIPHTMTLRGFHKDIKVIDSERRKKWAQQVECNIELLHEIGVVWGDGKPHNILVNSETDDCYLVDFGSSWTDGWVDAELIEMKADDLQALTRIFVFLDVSIADNRYDKWT